MEEKLSVTKEFEKSGEWSLTTSFVPPCTPDTLDEKIKIYKDLASKLGIELVIRATVSEASFDFAKQSDLYTFQYYSSYESEDTAWSSEEVFWPPNRELQEAWAIAATQLLNGAGIPHRIEMTENSVIVHFNSVEASLLFRHAQDSGWMKDVAENAKRWQQSECRNDPG